MAPHFEGFKPLGSQRKNIEDIIVNYEEYEALNLCDYELLTHVEAAKSMNVSRPTFTRIYESVRRKIAKAFIEGRSIRFEGGHVDFAIWYRCDTCKITFTLIEKASNTCPFCKAESVNINN